ncbi:IS66 family transposase [Micromonospora sp. LOL_023]|uniref:IS66 family transposase n=1 Tax=Micromonospora sp. LOL_023 TaxID=3345418 RepID=UPI003A8B3149
MAVDPLLCSREELLALVASQAMVIDKLQAQVNDLRAVVVELRRRLDADSSNSSRPPSSDSPFKRPPPKTSGMPGSDGPARKQGKQPGAAGKNRRQVDNPDERIGVEPHACTGCGTGLADADYRRQVFEASPPPPPRVVQYDVAERRCPCCGQVNQGRAPRSVTGRVQWGPGVSARAVLAPIGHHLPYARAAALLETLAGLPVSTGFLVNARRRAATLLDPFMVRVRELLHHVGLLHVDETTARAGGGRAYLHVACNDTYTAMHTGGRTNGDIDDGGILPDYTGIIVRDGYAGYQHHIDAVHAWCGAHTLRDLKGLHDADPAGQPGAQMMATTLVMALRDTRTARDAGHTALPADRLAHLRSAYAGAIAVMRDDNRATTRTPLQERGWSLANRFDTHRDMILAFLHDLSIPFTNNAAEREIRPVKVKQRAAGCWRTLDGLADFAIIWSYLSTATKHGLDHLDVLVELFTTGPWLPPDPTPG